MNRYSYDINWSARLFFSEILSSHTFVAVRESPFLSRLDVSYPQVVIVDEGYKVGVSGADLGVHAGP